MNLFELDVETGSAEDRHPVKTRTRVKCPSPRIFSGSASIFITLQPPLYLEP